MTALAGGAAWGNRAIKVGCGWTTLPEDTDLDFFVDYHCPLTASEVRPFARAPLRVALAILGKPLLMIDVGQDMVARRYRVIVGASALHAYADNEVGRELLSRLVDVRWSAGDAETGSNLGES